MTLFVELARDVPRVMAFVLPPEEQESCYILDQQLYQLAHFVAEFSHAMHLFDFGEQLCEEARKRRQEYRDSHPEDPFGRTSEMADEQELPIAWQWIAGRQGAILIWDCFRTIVNVRDTLEQCPTLQPATPVASIERVIAEFSKTFPDRKELRDAPAHAADLHRSPSKRKLNSVSGPYTGHGISMTENTKQVSITAIDGRTFVFTIRGQIVEYELSPATLQTLLTYMRSVFQAFRSAAQLTTDMMAANLRHP